MTSHEPGELLLKALVPLVHQPRERGLQLPPVRARLRRKARGRLARRVGRPLGRALRGAAEHRELQAAREHRLGAAPLQLARLGRQRRAEELRLALEDVNLLLVAGGGGGWAGEVGGRWVSGSASGR
jgi:hypothetical protein